MHRYFSLLLLSVVLCCAYLKGTYLITYEIANVVLLLCYQSD